MKRHVFALLLAGCICLAGCAQSIPRQAADGAAWDEHWVSVGNVIGIDTPKGLTPQENNDALTANGMYYATWSIGEAEPYTNEDGDEAQLYDAQVYVLLAGYNKAEKAKSRAAEWMDMASSQYAIEETSAETYNGQEFTVINYTYESDTNPYARGASAFGVYRNYAISVELSCREKFDGSAQEILAGFLSNCHYAA